VRASKIIITLYTTRTVNILQINKLYYIIIYNNTMWVAFFFQTALHWAAKHGNMDLVKMLAGTYSVNVNAKTVSQTKEYTVRVYNMLYCFPPYQTAIITIIFVLIVIYTQILKCTQTIRNVKNIGFKLTNNNYI